MQRRHLALELPEAILHRSAGGRGRQAGFQQAEILLPEALDGRALGDDQLFQLVHPVEHRLHDLPDPGRLNLVVGRHHCARLDL